MLEELTKQDDDNNIVENNTIYTNKIENSIN